MRGKALAAACAVFALIALAGPAGANGVYIRLKKVPSRRSAAGKPWLGVTMTSGKYGVKLAEVYRGSPADLAGLDAGDEILSIDGERLRSTSGLQDLVQNRREIGDEVDILLLRDGRRLRLSAVLGRYPDDLTLLRLLRVGAPAPALSLPVLYGAGSGKLEAHRGDVVVVAFASLHCRGCPGLFQELMRLSRRYGEQGLAVLAVSAGASTAKSRMVQGSAAPMLLLRDAGGRVKSAWTTAPGVRLAPPLLFVIDRDGVVRWVGRDLREMRTSVEISLRERNGVPLE